jgi:hypothetical protein
MSEYKHYISDYTDNILNLDLWGGSQVYYKDTESFVITRDCGFFSNVTVAMFGIFILSINGHKIKNFKLTMTDYSYDDIYPHFFTQNDEYDLNFSDLSEEVIHYFYHNSYPSKFGLGFPKSNFIGEYKDVLNLDITDRIIKKFFTPNKMVNVYFDKMFTNKNLKKDDYVFIWARRTDKIEENSIPNALKYYDLLKEEILLNDRIIIQTDDKTMIDEFNDLNFSFEYFDEIPFAKGYSFHRLISKTPDEEFFNNFNIDKNEYMTQIICIVLLALNAKKCLIYPGCGATVVPIYKNTYNNCFLFQNDTNLFK